MLGDVDHTKSGYVVTHPVSELPPGEIDTLEEAIVSSIVEFFAYWAQALSRLDATIKHHIAGLEKESASADS